MTTKIDDVSEIVIRQGEMGDVLEGGLREAARRLFCGERAMYRAAKKGELPFVAKIGGRYVVPRLAFERFLRGETKPGQSE